MVQFTAEQKMIQDMVRKLGAEKLAPRVQEIEETDEFPWDIVDILGDNGLLRIVLPEKYGGMPPLQSSVSLLRNSSDVLFLLLQGSWSEHRWF